MNYIMLADLLHYNVQISEWILVRWGPGPSLLNWICAVRLKHLSKMKPEKKQVEHGRTAQC